MHFLLKTSQSHVTVLYAHKQIKKIKTFPWKIISNVCM